MTSSSLKVPLGVRPELAHPVSRNVSRSRAATTQVNGPYLMESLSHGVLEPVERPAPVTASGDGGRRRRRPPARDGGDGLVGCGALHALPEGGSVRRLPAGKRGVRLEALVRDALVGHLVTGLVGGARGPAAARFLRGRRRGGR